MLDSVELKHSDLPITIFGLKEYGWKLKKHGKFPTMFLNSKVESLPNLTAYFPARFRHLWSFGSLPKIIFGHNAKLPNQAEVNEGLHFLSDYIEANSGVSFDAENATTQRVDFAIDLKISDERILLLIKKAALKTLPNKNKLLYNDSTLYLNSKDKAMSDSIRIYSKLQEVLNMKNPSKEAIEYAQNSLRVERTLKNGAIDRLVRSLGLPNKKAKTLFTQEISDFVMNEVLESLDFDGIEVINDSKLIVLLQHFPTKQASSLFGFLEFVKIYGLNFYRNPSLNYSRTTYYDNCSLLKDAHLWHLVESLE